LISSNADAELYRGMLVFPQHGDGGLCE
jgi:hypothetical protein